MSGGAAWTSGGSGSCSNRQALRSSPRAAHVISSPLPPALTNGSESPLVGTLTVATAILISACSAIMVPTPNASSRPKFSFFSFRICQEQ
jgi:hypothetical protein